MVIYLRIIDDTHNDVSISVNIFAWNTKTPPLDVIVDVVQLCCVSKNAYNGEVKVVFRKTFSSFALYKKGKGSDDLDSYQVSFKFQHWHKDKMTKSLHSYQLHKHEF